VPEVFESHPPVLQDAEAFGHGDFLGIRVWGTDIDEDVDGLQVVMLDDQGAEVPLNEDGDTVITFGLPVELLADGAFQGELIIEGLEAFPQAVGVRVAVLDSIDNVSDELERPLQGPPMLAEGEDCDARGPFGVCPEGMICLVEEDGPEGMCGQADTACPDDWGAIDLDPEWDGDTIRYEGDTTGSELFEGGTCGGGAGSVVHHLTLPAAGDWVVSTQETVGAAPDTVLSVRTYCAQAGTELACNDDLAGAGNWLSELVLVGMEADAEVYVFVDGYADDWSAWQGPYVLTVALAE